MKTTIHKANSRGHANHGWLDTHHTFSFANYYNPERMGFGNLRVLNDDIIAPGSGFGKHPHDNMEIISIPVEGALAHEDSMGNRQEINENEIQVMSAGTGIFHSEFNASDVNPANFLQLWILPEKRDVEPVYDQTFFDPEEANGKWQILVAKENAPLKINQNAKISRVNLSKGQTISYKNMDTSFGNYLFVISGSLQLNNDIIEKRDGAGIQNTGLFEIKAIEDSKIINIEV